MMLLYLPVLYVFVIKLIPYSVSWAEKYLTQTVEQQFFCLNGDRLEELIKTEDSEPMAVTPDSGAQGCLPVVQASNQPRYTSQQVILMIFSTNMYFR